MSLTEWSLGKRGSSAFTGTANRTVLNIGLVAVIVAVPLSILARSTTVSTGTPDWLIAVAIVALAIGIPHGAVDYLTFATLMPQHRKLVVAVAYLVLAIVATMAVLAAPGPAFIIVLAMTVLYL